MSLLVESYKPRYNFYMMMNSPVYAFQKITKTVIKPVSDSDFSCKRKFVVTEGVSSFSGLVEKVREFNLSKDNRLSTSAIAFKDKYGDNLYISFVFNN